MADRLREFERAVEADPLDLNARMRKLVELQRTTGRPLRNRQKSYRLSGSTLGELEKTIQGLIAQYGSDAKINITTNSYTSVTYQDIMTEKEYAKVKGKEDKKKQKKIDEMNRLLTEAKKIGIPDSEIEELLRSQSKKKKTK